MLPIEEICREDTARLPRLLYNDFQESQSMLLVRLEVLAFCTSSSLDVMEPHAQVFTVMKNYMIKLLVHVICDGSTLE